MDISIFGLGYVGTVSAGCLAHEGHNVIGIDVNEDKVALIQKGRSPIVEKDIEEIIRKAVIQERLSATTSFQDAVAQTKLSFICVGTPSRPNGDLNTDYVLNVCREIGMAIKTKSARHTIIVRSTMLPGTMRQIVIPTLEENSGKKAGIDFGVAINPEFLREGTAVFDYFNPPKTVVGTSDEETRKTLFALYEKLPGPKIGTDLATAELVKYMDNIWHALKISFANEIGNIAKQVGVDSHLAMDIFTQDTKLNISKAYLKPGFAFGGSCLPKDVRAILYKAKSLDLELPVISSILPSNRGQIENSLRMIMNTGKQKIGILGISFKAGTDDLRESPMVEVIERLIGKGFDVKLFDNNVNIASVVGANRDFILNHIPHISRLMEQKIEAVIKNAEVVVLGYNDPLFINALKNFPADKILIDFVRISQTQNPSYQYQGICW